MIESKNIPQHIAVIMDGNGRWAQMRHLPRTVGHAKGASVVRNTLESCAQRGVKYLTLFAFSTENWKRPVEEVSTLMGLFLQYLDREMVALQKAGVKFKVIGDVSEFSAELQQRILDAELATSKNDGICLTLAANYGGRWDIVQAFKNWKLANSQESVENLTIEKLTDYTSTAAIPEPDLLIRTGGEKRISNFLLWQCAYTELYFSDVLWTDFNEEELSLALGWFASRNRRFGEVKVLG
jgi:undecaprenyl diphosphate synthase